MRAICIVYERHMQFAVTRVRIFEGRYATRVTLVFPVLLRSCVIQFPRACIRVKGTDQRYFPATRTHLRRVSIRLREG